TVAVREINSRKVFIIGQVGHEGSYRINSTTTVLQIIAEAGGLRDFANRKGIYVLRTQNGAQQRLSFNYDQVIPGNGCKGNILLLPGDTIVVPYGTKPRGLNHESMEKEPRCKLVAGLPVFFGCGHARNGAGRAQFAPDACA